MSTNYSNVEEFVNYALKEQEKSIKELVSSVQKQVERGNFQLDREATRITDHSKTVSYLENIKRQMGLYKEPLDILVNEIMFDPEGDISNILQIHLATMFKQIINDQINP